MAMVPTTMPLAATTGLQVQLGDDEEREARRAAVLRDTEQRNRSRRCVPQKRSAVRV